MATHSTDQTLESLSESLRLNQVSFMVGAGISMFAPSNLPSGPEARDVVISSLATLPSLPLPLRRILRKHIDVLLEMTPERTFQALRDSLGSPFLATLGFFGMSRPNLNHYVLSELTIAGHVGHILKTNFDELIESASGQNPAITTRIYHLHGTVSKLSSLRATVDTTFASLGRKGVAQVVKAAKCPMLCVVGYSGLDHDVMGPLRKQDWRQVIWVSRPGSNRTVDAAGWHPSTQIEFLEFDLNSLFEKLASLVPPTPKLPVGRRDYDPVPIKEFITSRASNLSWPQVIHALGRVALDAGQISFQNDLYAKAWKRMDQGVEPGWAEQMSRIACDLAYGLYYSGDYSESMSWAERGLELALQFVEFFQAGANKNMLGLDEMELAYNGAPERYPRALTHFRSALEYYEQYREAKQVRGYKPIDIQEARTLNNMAVTYYNLATHEWPSRIDRKSARQAEAKFIACIQLKRGLSDFRGLALSQGTYGLLLAKTGESRRGLPMCRQAYKVLTQLDLYSAAYVARELAVVYRHRRQFRVSLRWFERASELLAKLDGVDFDQALIDWNKAWSLHELGQNQHANELREEAEKSLDSMGLLESVPHSKPFPSSKR